MAGIIANVFQKAAGGAGLPILDPLGIIRFTEGGLSTALNLTAAAVIKNKAGRIAKVIIIAPGSTSGVFSLNDAATVGAAAASNLVWTLPYNGTNNIAGSFFTLDWYCFNGIVLSAVPGGGSPIIAVSYT